MRPSSTTTPSKPSVFQRELSLQGTNATGTSSSVDTRDEYLRGEHGAVNGKSNGTNGFASSRKKLYTNVQVCARIRPLHTEREPLAKTSPTKRYLKKLSSGSFSSKTSSTSSSQSSQGNGAFVAWDISGDNASASQSNRIEKVPGRTHSFTLDRVFGPDSTTDGIYHDSVAPLVKAAMEGYNSTVLAYGQTSTGKTHTMTGEKDNPGLVPLCVKDCFKYVKENMSDESREYLFRFSYLEIYKEHIRDLLSSTSSAPQPVRLFDGPNGLVIRGLKEIVVSSPKKVFQLLKQGDKRRQVGATHMNQHSSRSHVVVRLKIESSLAKNRGDETRVSILSLVDLAGSESVRLNGTERREEGQYINKSLMALGQVVLGLSESCKANGERKLKSHIPYRDSKLTRLLQSSLSGNAQMLLMCCISPLASHLEESHNTFKFATRAKRIEQTASIQTAKDKDETLLQTYRNEIEDLKQQLAEASKQKQQLLEEQRIFQISKKLEEVPPENIEVVATAVASSPVNGSKAESNTMESTTGEIQELVEAIQTMEKLILKSRPLLHEQNSNGFHTASAGTSSNNEFDELLARDDLETEGDPDSLVDNDFDILSNSMQHDSVETPLKPPARPPRTPRNYQRTPTSSSVQDTSTTENQLHSELTRVRGLLATVLKKRGVASVPGYDPPAPGVASNGHDKLRKSLDFSSPSGDPPPSRRILDESLTEELEAGMKVSGIVDESHGETTKEAEEKRTELESLRMQLEQQERTTNLRKADSHFLQLQLEQKDKLLEEVSSLLEAVEKRQGELERENLALKQELNEVRQESNELQEEMGTLISGSSF